MIAGGDLDFAFLDEGTIGHRPARLHEERANLPRGARGACRERPQFAASLLACLQEAPVLAARLSPSLGEDCEAVAAFRFLSAEPAAAAQ